MEDCPRQLAPGAYRVRRTSSPFQDSAFITTHPYSLRTLSLCDADKRVGRSYMTSSSWDWNGSTSRW